MRRAGAIRGHRPLSYRKPTAFVVGEVATRPGQEIPTMAHPARGGRRISLSRLMIAVAIFAVYCGLGRAMVHFSARDQADELGIWLTALVPLVVLHRVMSRRPRSRETRPGGIEQDDR
jgi:hypothetical protein